MRKYLLAVAVAAIAVLVLMAAPLIAGEYQQESIEFERAFYNGDYANAVKLAETKVGKGNALNAQGFAAYESGDFDEAEKLFRAAIELDPEQYWAYNNLGAVLLYKGQVEEAIEMFEKSVEVNSKATDTGAAARVKKAMDNATTARSL